MAKLNILTLGSSKTYTKESLLGGGAVVGKNVTISSITPIEGGNKVTFSYTLDNGTVKTSSMNVMDGKDGIDGTNGKNGKDGQPGKDGTDGVGISKIEKIGTVDLVDTYRITFTDGSIFNYDVTNGKDGSGSSTGEENVIESIKVNGVTQSVTADKSVDITVPTKTSELTNDSGYLTEHQDISGKVDKIDGKSLISDTEISRLASVDNYDDTLIKSQIQAVANGLMDSVGYSADYKTIDIIAKNGVKKSVNVAPIISHASITELSDVDTTNKATGKALVYNATTSKHEYADVSGTDEKVKMDASTDAKYLGELLDNITIANENGELKVKKLDGQEVTITEINYLKGLTMNVMDLVNMFSNGGVKIINTPVATYAELLTLDKSSFIEGISYLVYVLADENHDNAKTTYLVDKDSETPTYFGFADSQRDFTTNPIDLATEITGKLGISNMDSDAIKALFTVDDTYKTETATNNAFSTHGAKALYDELLLAIGNKANSSDLTAHKDDTDIHVSTEDRTKWDSAKTHADSAHAPSTAQENIIESVKVNNQEIIADENKAVNIDLTGYAEHDEIIGENLIPYPYADGMSKTMNGVEYTVNPDGSVTAVGTAIETSAFVLAKSLSIDPNTTYILSGDLDDEITYKSSSILFNAETSSGTSYWNYGKDKPVIFTGISVMANFRIRISKDETVNQTFYPMLEVGTIAHEYQPYNLSREALRTDIDNVAELASRVDNQFSTASGDYITVNDSVDGKLVELGVKGNSFQNSYSGYNLLPYPFYHTSKTVGNITVTDNNDGSITINGDNGDTSVNVFDYVYRNHTFKAGTYHVSGVGRGWIGAYNIGTITSPIYSSQIYDGELTFTVDTDFDLLLRSTCEPNGSYNNVTYYPMLVEVAEDGSYPTEYEAYCGGIPAPNPSYPQEITSVGDDGSLVVKSCGKNLIPFPYHQKSGELNGVMWTVKDDGTVIANGTATKETSFNYINPFSSLTRNKLIPNQTYTFFDGINEKINGVYTQVVRYNIKSDRYEWSLSSRKNRTFTTTNENLLTFGYRTVIDEGITVNNLILKPQLEIGTNTTDFNKYESSTSTIPLSEPLRSIGDVKDEITYQDGKWGVLRRIRKVVIDGDTNKVALFNDTTLNLQRCTLVLSDLDKTYTNKADAAISDKFIGASYSNSKDGSLYVNTTGVCCIFANNTFANVDEANNWFVSNNTVAIYRLATPVFEPFADQTLPYLSTYDGVTNISNDDALSAEMTVKYPTTDASGVGSRNESKIAELDNNKIDKSSIVASLSSSSTDTQVPSAKVVYDNCISGQLKDYYVCLRGNTDMSNFGIADISTLASLLDLTKGLGYNKRFTIQVNVAVKDTLYNSNITPTNDAGLLVITSQAARGSATYVTYGGKAYVCSTDDSTKSEWTAWQRVCTTTVADVTKTTINTFEDETYVKPNKSNLNDYVVKNGICNIRLETVCLSTSAAFTKILSGLPKPMTVQYQNAINRNINLNVDSRAVFQIGTDGTMYVACKYGDESVTGARNFYVSFSYPVAES